MPGTDVGLKQKGRESACAPLCLLVLFGPTVDGGMPPDTPRNDDYSEIRAALGPVESTHETNHHRGKYV